MLGLSVLTAILWMVGSHDTLGLVCGPVAASIFLGIVFSMIQKGDAMGFIMLAIFGFGMGGMLWVVDVATNNVRHLLGMPETPHFTWPEFGLLLILVLIPFVVCFAVPMHLEERAKRPN